MTASATPISALLADADERFRDEVVSLCTASGWRCDCLTEPSRVVEAATRKYYDVIIAEVPSERFAAEELLWKLRLSNPHQALLVVTNNGSLGGGFASSTDGAVEVLAKPVSKKALLESVERVIGAVRTRERTTNMYRFMHSERTRFEFRTDEIARVQPALIIAERLERAGKIDELLRKRLEVAFQEAVANACDHGNLELESSWKEVIGAEGLDQYSVLREERLKNKEFAARSVVIVTEFTGDKLEIRISNQGRGFIPHERTISATEPLCSGRGLAMIRQTMDKVWHENDGREIVMVKNIAPQNTNQGGA